MSRESMMAWEESHDAGRLIEYLEDGRYRHYETWERVVMLSRWMPSPLDLKNPSWWADIRQVILDPEADPVHSEIVWRWIRDRAEESLRCRVADDLHGTSVWMAILEKPRLLWKLPHHWCRPREKFHSRIVAALLPREMHETERLLRTWAAPNLDAYGCDTRCH